MGRKAIRQQPRPEGNDQQNAQSVGQLFVHLHDGCLVATAVAVVGGTEDSDHVAIMGPVVSLHYQLVRT